MKEQLEIAQERRKMAASKKVKTVKSIKKYLTDQKTTDNSIKKKELVTRKRKLSETSSESDVSSFVCDDDEVDDSENFDNVVRRVEPNEVCGICNEFGLIGEL